MLPILDEMTTLTVTHAGEPIQVQDAINVVVEEVAIMVISGMPHLVVRSTVEVPPRPGEEEAGPQRTTILVGNQRPIPNLDEESPELLRSRMEAARMWRSYLDREGEKDIVLRVLTNSTTPFMVKCGDHSERAAYYESIGAMALGRAVRREEETHENALTS